MDCFNSDLTVMLPNPSCKPYDEIPGDIDCMQASSEQVPRQVDLIKHVVPLEKYSNFDFALTVMANVLRYISNIKRRISKDRVNGDSAELHQRALMHMVAVEQRKYFADAYAYLDCNHNGKRNMPEVISRYNLFREPLL